MISIFDSLREITVVSMVLRLLLAMAFGGIVGLERGNKRRAAGFRTYMLVCLGATLVMLTNQYITNHFELADPSRLGAQVISGIGFLGIGTIIVTRQNQVIGLTTAAGLWASACVGLALGIGFYEGAIAACLLVFFIFTVMHRVDKALTAKSRSIELYVELTNSECISGLLEFAHSKDFGIRHVEFTSAKCSEHHSAVFISLYLPKRQDHSRIVQLFAKTDGVAYIEEI